ncbi:MAG: DedA family protein [Rikenellaceae bacterium]|jgi:membrane protein YqaA with SNARE-associated domain|nr:DedA family protein [Rikenellaceae bacterium]
MDWLIDLGYIGLFIGTFVAGTVLPLSSDVLLVGLLAAGGSPIACLIVATLGNWLGAMTSYVLGWYAKWEWLDKYFKIKPETIERQRQRIDRYGIWLAAVYWAPIVGIVIMVALGLYKTRPRATALIALVGAFLRFLFWILLNAVWQQTTLFS